MRHHVGEFHFRDFSDLDASEDADYLAGSMDVMASLKDIQSIKTRAIEALCLRLGDSVLEMGCGHGKDAEILGQIVGEKGKIIAIDMSHRMIHEAQRRSRQPHVHYRVADARQLDYPDDTFSACYADRLLVSHHDYTSFFRESFRLVKPGGIICFTDVDALSIVMSPFDKTTSIILDSLHKSFVNPYMGRILPELFVAHGLKTVTILPAISMIQSFTLLCKIFQFQRIAESAVHQGLLTPPAIQEWFDTMKLAEKEGRFLYSVTFFTVVGKVPS
jgi:ubiquinone/menaquinone biosynthesis C-methylase UbiE